MKANKIILSLLFTLVVCRIATASEGSSFKYDDKGKRDPFWPLVNTAGTITSYETSYSIAELTLEGILTGANGENVAMINGRILRKSDELGQFVISEIRDDSILLSSKGQIFKLQLKKEE